MVEALDERPCKKVKTGDEGDDGDLPAKIAKQVEYYFSDVNVVKDKFLLEEFKKNDGWVKLPVLLTFSRLKQLTEDESKIIKALKENPSDVIEVDEAEKRVRRKNPVPDAEEYKKQLDLRTVHISGFPTDYSFEELRKFCAQHGDVESVAMRRHFKTRFFKGCIHVVYKSEADAKKVLEIEGLKIKDRELRTESMEHYHKRKDEMREKRKEKKKAGS